MTGSLLERVELCRPETSRQCARNYNKPAVRQAQEHLARLCKALHTNNHNVETTYPAGVEHHLAEMLMLMCATARVLDTMSDETLSPLVEWLAVRYDLDSSPWYY